MPGGAEGAVKCKRSSEVGAGFEMWQIGWGEPFSLTRQSDGRYADASFVKAMLLIHKTMPHGWFFARDLALVWEAINELRDEVRRWKPKRVAERKPKNGKRRAK